MEAQSCPRRARSLPSMRLAILSIAALLFGCGNNGSQGTNGNGDGAGASGGDEPGSREEGFIVAWNPPNPDQPSTLYQLVSEIGPETTVDTRSAIEVGGFSYPFPTPSESRFLASGGEAPIIDRYQVGMQLVLDGTVSFANLGVSVPMFGQVVQVDDTRSVYLDDVQRVAVVFDPTDMVIVDVIDFPDDIERDGFAPKVRFATVRGSKVLVPLAWESVSFESSLDEAALVTVDLDAGTATAVVDSRCPAAQSKFEAPNGDEYYFSSIAFVYFERVLDDGRAHCALRIRAGEETFDPDYVFEFNTLGEDEPIAFVGWGGGTRVYVRVLDEGLFSPPAGTTYGEFFGAGAWRLASFDIASPSGGLSFDGSSPAACCGSTTVIAGTPYLVRFAPDFATSTLLDVSGEQPAESMNFPGVFAGAVPVVRAGI